MTLHLPHPGADTDRFRQLAERAPVGIVDTDHTGAATYVNQQWREITGCDLPTPIPFSVMHAIIVPEERERIDAVYVEAARARADFDVTTAVLRPDGTIRHVRMQGAPVVANGELAGYVGTVMDLTEQVEATRALEASERRYRELMVRAPIGQAVFTLDGTILEVNDAWCRLVGRSPDQVVGTSMLHYLHPDEHDGAVELVRRLVEGVVPAWQEERRLVHAAGHHVWVESSLTTQRDEHGRIRAIHSLVLDISDRKATEQELRASEERYRAVVESLHDGVLVRGPRGIESMNARLAEMLNHSPEELATVEAWEAMAPVDERGNPITPATWTSSQVIERGEPVLGRVVGLDVPGRGRRWFNVNSYPLHDGDEVIGAVLSYTDITDRRAAEEALRHSERRYRELVDHAPLAYVVAELDGTIVEANRAVAHLLGYEQHEFIGRNAADLTHPDDLEDLAPAIVELFEGRRSVVEADHRLLTCDGDEVWVAATMSLLSDGGDDPSALLLLGLDVTERRKAEERLRASEVRFRSLAESLPVGVYRTDAAGNMVYVNPRWHDVTRLGPDDTLPERRVSNVHPDDLARVQQTLGAIPGPEGPQAVEYRIIDPDGSVRWVRGRGGAVVDDDGRIDGYIGSIEDITPLMEAQEQNARLAAIVETTSDLVGVIDWNSDNLVYLNRAARHLFGIGDDEVTSRSHLDLYAPEVSDTVLDEIIPTLLRGESWTGELPMLAADGSTVHVWQTLTVTRWRGDQPAQVSSVGRDVTDRRRFEEELAWQATHDPLTALPNRVLLLDHLELALARARRDGTMVALLFLDLDRFKNVNDSLGHDVGDALLRAVAERLTGAVRPADTVARIGGDEFVVLCEDIEDEQHAITVAQRIASSIESSRYSIGENSLTVSASVGIALSSGDEAHPEVLLRDADAAMYRAKDLGRARLELFDEAMRQRAARRTELADQLAGGIEHDHIVVHYQPGIDLRTGAIASVEALVRWNHPDKGLLSPDEFITIAEETGLIVGLGLAVLSKACQEARAWEIEHGDAAPRVHVNLSARQLTSGNLPTLVRGVLDATGLSPHRLCLEITESVLMEDASAAIEMLEALKATGVSIAIDDFGTGYSSLSYLRRFPVDVLKVDRSFVDGLGPDPEDSAIVAAIVGLAHTLDLWAVAEGVETAQQLAALRRLGCHGAQGFHFARPLPAAQLRDLLGTRFPIE